MVQYQCQIKLVTESPCMEMGVERNRVVNSFCDKLDGGGARKCNSGLKNFQEITPLLRNTAPLLKMKVTIFDACARSCLLYGSETWPITSQGGMENEEKRHKKNEEDVQLKALCDKSPDENLRKITGFEEINDIMRRRWFRWNEQKVKRNDKEWLKEGVNGVDDRGNKTMR